MEHHSQIETVSRKLFELRNLDTQYRIFGSSSHEYELLPTKPENQLREFEKKYNITLPEGYRDYLLLVGNGVAGPGYGLESLESSLYVDLDSKKADSLIDPSKEFPLTEKWNLDFEELDEDEYFQQKDEIYFASKWENGLLRLSNFGCGIWVNIVVNGPEYGNIWIDDRCNEGGIYPDRDDTHRRLDFLTWYEIWLDKSLSEILGQNCH